MVGTVTLGIDRYNALYKRALQADALEKENAELRERLNSTTDVSYEVVDVIDFEMINKEIEKLKEMNESLKMRLNDEKRLYEYKLKNEEEKHVGMIAKPIKGSKLRSRNRYATGGLVTKEEVTELKRSKKNQRRLAD